MHTRVPARLLLAFALLAFSWIVSLHSVALAQPDPLPSWNDGPARRSILTFVERVTRDGGADYVKPAERIAAFDNDGTLWAEQPMYFQFLFALDRVRMEARHHPEWREKQPFKAVLENDAQALGAAGEKGVVEIMAATHAGMTTGAFASIVTDWLSFAKHPRFDQPFEKLVYRPQIELLAYLRQNGFKIFIVSGGGVEFMRVFAERAYGIPPEQVIGSSGATRFQLAADGTPELVKEAKVEFVDDGPGKPSGINRFIGRRPIFAFGNSDGDLQMLQWTGGGSGPRFMGLLHHTDAEREWAYDRNSHVGKLDKALDESRLKGWTVIDMKQDWKRVFAFEQ